ncbi:glycosyltransferase family 2 protein [Enterococcus pingfangensis]|uniref:glycosyltransferase family 2 protein n=1 Tax=Enterococcus pingfangensis TaxID=2559924 RepID=UPI0010F8117C|nr:glycosyltransferase family 2 protein [Enterococcus pingfangensis]
MGDVILKNIDNIYYRKKSNQLIVTGWAIDTIHQRLPEIAVEPSVKVNSSQVRVMARGDVIKAFNLPPYVSVGFKVEIELVEKSGVIVLDFHQGEHSVKEEIDLNKSYASDEQPKSSSLKVLFSRLRRGLAYIKRNGLLNTFRRLKIEQNKSNETYSTWISQNEQLTGLQPIDSDIKISIVIPVYNIEKKWLSACIDSICQQSYVNWELCLADDNSTRADVFETLSEYEKLDERIKVIYRNKNGHISAATNSAISIATGDFIALVDNDDLLAPNALAEVVTAIKQNPNIRLIYSDEDKIDENGVRSDPAFKPDWAPDLLMGTNYISHLSVFHGNTLRTIGGLREGYEGAQDYDLLLRFVEQISPNQIYHIPKVLYHWRMLRTSTAINQNSKKYAFDAGKRALEDALQRRSLLGKVDAGPANGLYKVHYDIQKSFFVSIIIPTKNGYNDVKRCVDSIIDLTTYPYYEIVIADNGSDDKKMEELYESYIKQLGAQFRVVELPGPFNFSRINNMASKEAKGDFLLFLNNDTQVIAPNWLTDMVSVGQLEHTGVVGAKLYYANNTIQHSGVVVGLGGVAGHVHLNYPKGDFGYFGRLAINVNYLAVTAACCLIKRNDFEMLGGFDETFVVAYNDVDLCIRCYDKLGKYNVFIATAELYHYESKSRGYEDTPEKQARFLAEAEHFRNDWMKYVENDPFYNRNLTVSGGDFSARV